MTTRRYIQAKDYNEEADRELKNGLLNLRDELRTILDSSPHDEKIQVIFYKTDLEELILFMDTFLDE